MIKSCCSVGEVRGGGGVEVEEPKGGGSLVLRLGIGVVVAGQSMVFGIALAMTPLEDMGGMVYWLLHLGLLLSALLVFGLLGGELLVEMYRSIKGRVLTIESLFLLSILGAFGASCVSMVMKGGQVYFEVVSIVLVIYRLGKFFTNHSRGAVVRELGKVREEFNEAWVRREVDGGKEKVKIEELNCCSQVVVPAGEAITVDGVILEGGTLVKETVVTGELEAVWKGEGDWVYAGSYNVEGGEVRVKPMGLKGGRRLDAILGVVEGASIYPSGLQVAANRLMSWFVPLVVMVGVGTFLVRWGQAGWVDGLFRSMSVLLIACPCALGLATPLAVWTFLSRLSFKGLISGNGNLVDGLAGVNAVVFDKTGTLSEEEMVITGWEEREVDGVNSGVIKAAVWMIQREVEHAISRAFRGIGGKELEAVRVEYGLVVKVVNVVVGKGVEGQVMDGEGRVYVIKIGRGEWAVGGNFIKEGEWGVHKKVVFIGVNGELGGMVYFDEKWLVGVEGVMKGFLERKMRVMVLTGDEAMRREMPEGVEVYVNLGPEGKAEVVRGLKGKGYKVLYIGDGMNDLGAMSESEVSLGMVRSEALVKTNAMGVCMEGAVVNIPSFVDLSKRVCEVVKTNMVFAICYNIIGIFCAAMGYLHPIVAALVMFLSSGLVSWRVFRVFK